MNITDDLSRAFSHLSTSEGPKLVPLDIKNIGKVAWYKRLEMSIQLAVHLQKLHDSGRVHRLISLECISFDAQGRAVLELSEEEMDDRELSQIVGWGPPYIAPERMRRGGYIGSYKPDDIYALGCVLYKLLFLNNVPWKDGYNTKKDVESRLELLREFELLSDDEAAKFLTYWMCHPQPEKRPTSKDVAEMLKAISENGHTPVYCHTPSKKVALPDSFFQKPPQELAQEVESLFTECVHNGYFKRGSKGTESKIICLSNWIICLPKKSCRSVNQLEGTFKRGRVVTLLEKTEKEWVSRTGFALSSKKGPFPHSFKACSRKERALYSLLEEKRLVPKHILSITFADKPDKILSIYEYATDLFTKLLIPLRSEEEKIALTCKIIDAVLNLHKEGFTHRDLKSENILVASDKSILFCDLDKMVRREAWRDIPERVGTAEHAPPERFIRTYAGSWDGHEIYSLGATMLEILSGMRELPWNRDDCPTEEEQVSEKWRYEPEAEAARKALNEPRLSPLKDRALLLKHLADWMVHPNVTKRATWDDVVRIRGLLSL